MGVIWPSVCCVELGVDSDLVLADGGSWIVACCRGDLPPPLWSCTTELEAAVL